MRLIDADSIYKFSLRSLERLDKPLDYLDGWNEAIDALEDEAPTVDAVPVSFLYELRDNAQNEDAALIIDEIIAQWRKENEAD